MSSAPNPKRPPAWRRYLDFWGPDIAADVEDELRFHLEMRAAEYAARGLAPDAARSRAEQRFGNIHRARQACAEIDRQQARAATHADMLLALRQDVVYALRVLRRQWLPALAAVLCMAIGVSATTAMFSVADTLLLRPLPYPNGDRLVSISTTQIGAASSIGVSSYLDYRDWRAAQHSFDDMGAIGETNFIMLRGEPRRVSVSLVSASFFPTFGVGAELGRVFSAADDQPGAAPVMIVSDAFARHEFGEPSLSVGQSVMLNGIARTIIGVIPDRWRYPSHGEAWLPLATGGYSGFSNGVDNPSSRGNRNLQVFGTLRRGVALDDARRELAAVAARLQHDWPGSNAQMTTAVTPMRDEFVGEIRGSLYAVMGATMLVLLIACANVAALQLARASARTREIAVRTAIGASRGRIIRQLLTESVVLSLGGGALGAVLAIWARELIRRAVAPTTPAWMPFAIDGRVLLFAFGVSVLAGIAFGVAPALRLADTRAGLALRNATVGSSRSRLQRAFVIAEVAISVMLVVSASLALESVWRIARIPLGIDPDGVATFEVTMQSARYDQPAARARLVAEIEEQLRELPGVIDAGAADRMPIDGCCSQFPMVIDRRSVSDGHEPFVTGTIATPGYFATLHVHVLSGRTFTSSDDASAPKVMVINQTFADKYWPNGGALGHQVNTGIGQATIVGVVQDVKQASIFGAPEPQFFRPYAEDPWTRAVFAVRARGDLAQVAAAARRVVRSVDPTMPIFNVRTLQAVFDEATLTTRSLSQLLMAFAGIALLLAATGLYGLISFLVERRTRELGLRVALGAEPSRVARMVIVQACALAAMGVIVGIGGATLAAKWLSSTLYGVTARESSVYVLAALILGAASLAASYAPARRASRADPMDALRAE
ncbi:MAG TPA: ABC transporter permease [Gemmatimonadaceae bacterium]|nr:ABC transporter permease [Gemmatimonadaceae bacterium]